MCFSAESGRRLRVTAGIRTDVLESSTSADGTPWIERIATIDTGLYDTDKIDPVLYSC